MKKLSWRPVEYTNREIITTSPATCSPPCQRACGSQRKRMRCRIPRVIQKMTSGRKKRLVLRPGIYCGQTTPIVRISVIVSKRTRVNQSSHSLIVKLLSIARPRLVPASGHPQVQAGITEDGEKLPVLRKEDSAERTEARLVHRAQLAEEREQRQVHGNDHSADDHAKKNDHDGLECGQQVFHRRVNFFFVEVSDLLQHGIHRASLFADGNHLCDHARKHFGFLQGLGKGLAFLE